jgi:hypothetical protein
VQNLGDHAIAVFAVTQGHDSTLSRSQIHLRYTGFSDR